MMIEEDQVKMIVYDVEREVWLSPGVLGQIGDRHHQLVSRIIRGGFAVMFGMIPLYHPTQNGQTTHFIRECPDFI